MGTTLSKTVATSHLGLCKLQFNQKFRFPVAAATHEGLVETVSDGAGSDSSINAGSSTGQ